MDRFDLAKRHRKVNWEEMPVFNLGDWVTIEGEITFWMDFSFWRGDFDPDLLFCVTGFSHEKSSITLVAPGYGEKGNYGSGSIFVGPKNHRKLKLVARAGTPVPKGYRFADDWHGREGDLFCD
jgi:hypothetical protein